MRRLTIQLGVLAVAGAIAASGSAVVAGTPAQNAAFAKQLKGMIGPVFKKQAPKLVLGNVTCVLPKNGTVVRCKAHFGYPSGGLNVVYAIKATLLETGKIKWTTTSHSCTDAKTAKTVAC